MHIYSFRLWMVMITVFTGVSVARADEKCWVMVEVPPTKTEIAEAKASKSRLVIQEKCVEGKIEYASLAVRTCRVKGASPEMVYFYDPECRRGPRAVNANTGKIPNPGKDKVYTGSESKKEKARVQREGGTLNTPYGGIGSAGTENKAEPKPFGFGSAADSKPAE